VSDPQASRVILHVTTEAIFAVLPLVVLAIYWPDRPHGHPVSFWWGPEVSMTACILYGLTLSKLIFGSIIATRKASQPHTFSAWITFLAVILVLCIIFSTVVISKLSTETDQVRWLVAQYINFAVAISLLFILGGYGIRATDSSD
jgi:hypothetical protein